MLVFWSLVWFAYIFIPGSLRRNKEEIWERLLRRHHGFSRLRKSLSILALLWFWRPLWPWMYCCSTFLLWWLMQLTVFHNEYMVHFFNPRFSIVYYYALFVICLWYIYIFSYVFLFLFNHVAYWIGFSDSKNVKPKCWGIYSWLLCCCGVCNMKSLESFVKEFILVVTFLNLTTDMYGRNIKSHYPYDITTFHYINIHCYHSSVGCNCVAVSFYSYL